MEKTTAYYDAHARQFDERTRAREMDELYDSFLEHVPEGGLILDAGCGPGRDAVAFAARGYHVTAIDASAAMVALASERLSAPAYHMSFNQLAFDRDFDGIWACASLLHVTRADLPQVMRRLHAALKTGGVMFASFKYGRGEEHREGRWFNDYDESSFDALLQQCAGWRPVRIWQMLEERKDRRVLWLNALLHREPSP
jgi:SAM-dependent methyltransferase